ncbi:MAG: phage tail protein [Deltaproteobacteria bacterium]|nr:phage tail protein [Deltaproteobacteria bacterium]MCW5809015.1 phage tail protein [Deltaproteobacteria bacterium]
MTADTHSTPGGYTIVPAVVTKNEDDDEKLGRVKVRYPWMTDQQESGWIQVASPTAGKERGFYFIPEVEDLVLIAFAFGEIDRAYVIGSLWNKVDKPPVDDRHKRIIKSVAGHTITLDDTEDAELISIVDKSGKNKIVLDAKNNVVSIESDGDLSIKSKGKLELSSDDDVSIKGKNVVVEATSKSALKGSEVAINGPSGVKVNDGALEVM